ncbi:MAG: hypothetical protein P4L96_13630 [Rhodoferax sp.]|nr:hypothetical protein [Rhodoferax sp.]
MRKLEKFSPIDLTAEQVAGWVENGDIHEAEQVAAQLAVTLRNLAEHFGKLLPHHKEYPGIFNVSPAMLKLIAARLSEPASNVPGKSRKSGAELFAKVLVPGKATKAQFEAQWIASVAWQLGARSEANCELAATAINQRIKENNAALEAEKWREYGPAIPRRPVTASQVDKALRQYKPAIDAAEKA